MVYGLTAGDALLRRVGGKLREGRQRAFRYGNDEFAVLLLGGSGEARARRVAAASVSSSQSWAALGQRALPWASPW